MRFVRLILEQSFKIGTMQIVYTYLMMLVCINQTHKASGQQGHKDTEVALEKLPSCKHRQAVKLESIHLPTVNNCDMEMDFGTRVRFDIGMTDNQIIGNMTFEFNDEAIGACLMIKLSVLIETRIVESQYFQIYPINKLVSLVASIDCIQIPKSPNITLSAELFQMNQSFTCDFNMLSTDGNGCSVYRVFGYNFTTSEEACIFYRDHSPEQPRLTLVIHKLSGNLSRFQVLMQNINPFASIHVWVFPDEDWLTDAEPVLSQQPTASKDGIIFLSVIKEQEDNTKYFYATMKVSCMVNDPDYEHYFSNSATVTTQGVVTNGTSKNSVITENETERRTLSEGAETIVTLGALGAVICLCCVVTLVVWLARSRHHGCRKVHRYDRPCRESAVLQNNRQIFTAETSNEDIDDIDTYSTVNRDYMCKYSDVNGDYMDTYSDVNVELTTNKNVYVMVLSHPDTDAHEKSVKTLTACLENSNINVRGLSDKIWTNWRDFAEQAGDECHNFVIVLSDELIELIKLYRSREQKTTKDVCRWNDLLLKRHGEYIPCVVLEKLRTVHQEKGACFSVHVVNLIENATSLKKEFTRLYRFVQTHDFLRDNDITFCYKMTREEPSLMFNLLPLIKCLTEKLK